jgi:predicted membrane protein
MIEPKDIWPEQKLARAISLTLAGTASLVGLVFPFLLARQPTGLNQSILLVMVAGIAGAFIHGAGFSPHSWALQRAISPWLTWPLILGCSAVLILIR